MPDDRRCNCRFAHVEGLKGHEPGCPMLLPRPPVVRDPMRLAFPVAAVTGNDSVPIPPLDLHGIPEAVGVTEPLTHRVGEYMGQPREAVFGTEDRRDGWTGFAKDYGTPAKTIADLGLPAVVHSIPTIAMLKDVERLPNASQELRDKAQQELGRIALAPLKDVTKPLHELVAGDLADRVNGTRRQVTSTDPDAAWAAYGSLLDACMDLRRWLMTRDRK